ncbi:MAG: ABC transporter substrate-binding protein [Clostridium sp.]
MKNRFKKIIAILSVFVLSLGLVACGGDSSNKTDGGAKVETTQYPFTVKDSNGKEVIIESEPKKIISVGPNVTEMIFALGKGDLLVGRTKYCDYPEEALKVQEIGSLLTPNIELIAELKPDLVIASTHFKEEAAKKLEELNIKTIVLYSEENFDGVYSSIETLGKILNSNEKASEIVKGMKAKVASVQEKVKGLEAPSMYYVVGYGQKDSTAGGDTFIGQMIEMAGGNNIAKDSKGWGFSKEALAEKNPSMIVLSKYNDTKAAFTTTDFYKGLPAVKDGKVYEIDENKLNRQGPRLADGLEELAKILHPEAFK